MNTDLMFSSKTDQWATPQDFFEQLDREFHFTLDPCADDTNHKCERYFTREQDGLKQDWSGEVVFCNPPYGRKVGKWVEKCFNEVYAGGCKCAVLLLFANTDTKWFHDYVYHKAEIRFIKGRLKFGQYDRVYKSKVFDETYSSDIPDPCNTKEIIKGGTGYGLDNKLPDEIEHMYPDYSLYPELTKDTAYGFLARGCPRGCPFCIVCAKEGRKSCKVADLDRWWNGQKEIVLCDPNLLACKDHMSLLEQLAESKALVDMNQGVDARMLTEANVDALCKVRMKNIHFAWDLMDRSDAILKGLNLWREAGKKASHGAWGAVYVLTNFNTTMEENLYRVYTLRDMGFDPYIMVYDKPNAPREVRLLQRWCNNKYVFKSTKRFEDYNPHRA